MSRPPERPLDVLSRRGFIRAAGGSLLWVVAAGLLPSGCGDHSPVWRMILSDPALCAACSRCAITCAALRGEPPGPALALVSPDRTYQALQFETARWQAETCRMCPAIVRNGQLVSPACVAHCPTGAARIADRSQPPEHEFAVRFIDAERCIGCGSCALHCPYGHPVLYEGKAHKCDLCMGREPSPPCVEACPSSALSYLDYWSEQSPRPFAWERGA